MKPENEGYVETLHRLVEGAATGPGGARQREEPTALPHELRGELLQP